MKQYHKNPRQITERQMQQLTGSLSELGDLSGIVHDLNSDEIVGGNQRGRAFNIDLCEIELVTDQLDDPDAQGTVAHGFIVWKGKRYAYRQVRWTPEQCAQANIQANKLGGTWDFDVLANEFEIPDLLEWGFEEWELGIEPEQPEVTDTEPQIDRAEELRQEWGVESGQLWQLGEHRLICGDCTDAEVVGRLMDGEKASAVVTDPPYGINREGITNDNPEGLRVLFDGCLSAMPVADGVLIAFQSPRLEWIWLDASRDAGCKIERLLWMYDENDQTKPWHYWLMCSQAIRITSIGNPEWAQPKAHHDTYVIGLARENRAGGADNEFAHASVKPVGVVQDLTAHTVGIVYEPFCGSGTTIIACENLGRKCRAIEISPAYVAVALQRWADHTGQTPAVIAA